MNVPSFSIVVTARNEALTLPRLVESLNEFLSAGGEMVVVDTGSEDDTVRVAREAGARVEAVGNRFHSLLTEAEAGAIEARFARNGEGPLVEAGQLLFDFGRAREFAAGLASNDYVWHIDASDIVVSADYEFIDREIRGGRANNFEYAMKLGSSSFHVVRLFDRRVFEWRGRVHEGPFGRDSTSRGVRVVLNEQQLSLRHLRQEKSRNYLAGLALDVIEHPTLQRWQHYLGRELYYFRKYRSAISVLRRHTRRREGWAVEKGESLCLIGACLEALGRKGEAAESYFRASRVDPSRRQPLLKLAALCQSGGDFQGSVTFAAASLMVPRSTSFIDEEENFSHDPHALLYWGLFWLGRREEAKAHWEICRRMAPENETFLEHARLFAGTDTAAGF